MVTTLRIDENLKRDCEAVFAELGLNMTSAVTIFLRQVVRQRGIPFAVTCEHWRSATEWSNPGLRERGVEAGRLFSEMRRSCGSEMSLGEVNAEIAAARAARRARNGTVGA